MSNEMMAMDMVDTNVGMSAWERMTSDPKASMIAGGIGLGIGAGIAVGAYFIGKKHGYNKGFADGSAFDPTKAIQQVGQVMENVTQQAMQAQPQAAPTSQGQPAPQSTAQPQAVQQSSVS